MELRDIEIFLVLADELHFGRAADRLHVSPARVSQAIKKQERRIGGPLFERTSRHVALTPLGRQLRADLQVAYKLLHDGIETAAAAARGQTGTLTLGTLVNHAAKITPVVDLFRSRHPDCELRIREITFSDPFTALRSGHIDVALLWLPVREPDLTAGPVVHIEPMSLAVATTHPLAARDVVEVEDLAGLTVPASESAIPDYWEYAHTPRTTPAGHPIHRGVAVATVEEALTVIAAGDLVALIGRHAVTSHPRPGITYVPVSDAHHLRYAPIWRTAAESPLVRAFAQAARDGVSRRM
ncbi:MAG: LysR family transcriptional regulator [Hamadaea sp.]|nr:LysR family transcriptional regulator [Hamadaea sp.]